MVVLVICFMLLIAVAIIAKQVYTIGQLREELKDSNAKYHSLLHYFDDIKKAKPVKNKK